MVRIQDTVFVHAGIGPTQTERRISEINNAVRQVIIEFDRDRAHLVKLGYTVRALVRDNSPNAGRLSGLDVEVVTGDVCLPDTLGPAGTDSATRRRESPSETAPVTRPWRPRTASAARTGAASCE